MGTSERPRVPAGSPNGGEFAPTEGAESATVLHLHTPPRRAILGSFIATVYALQHVPPLTTLMDKDGCRYMVAQGQTRFGDDLVAISSTGNPGNRFSTKFAEAVLPLTVVGVDRADDLQTEATNPLARATRMVADYAVQHTDGETETAAKDILTDLHQWAHANDVDLEDLFFRASEAARSEREEDAL